MSSIIADVYMEVFEKRARERAPLKPALYKRYVDETLLVWPHGQEALREFVCCLNGLHKIHCRGGEIWVATISR